MQSGPSKEELKEYWKNSRQYFDELAKTYRQSDPKYYEEYIAPFYRNPLYGMGGGKQRRGGSLAIVSAIFFLAIGAGAAFFILQNQVETGSDSDTEKKTEPVRKTVTTPDTTGVQAEQDYEKGLKYFNEGDYDNAEKYLRKVKSPDKNYADARKKLNEIVRIKKKKMEEELKSGRQRGIERRR